MSLTNVKLPLVDLFAGCGGLSLGLEQAGFTPIFVNELHPDGLATYLANRQDLDVSLPNRHSNDILEITRNADKLQSVARSLRRSYGDIALVAGGPPCQGYSARGIRATFSDVQKLEMPSNHLYREMANFVAAVAPRAFLFENVYGLINAKWTKGGDRGEIWQEVQKAFAEIEVRIGAKTLHYQVAFKVVKAKDFGVPQNRPRVLLIGIRSDIPLATHNKDLASILFPSPSLSGPDLVDVLGDLVDPTWSNGGETTKYPGSIQNEIQQYFRTDRFGQTTRRGSILHEQEYSSHSPKVLERYQAMINSGGIIPEELKTLKFGQKLLPSRWGVSGPTITATSSPDDYVHFLQPRILTVREWARLQMFPDSYIFCGKRTTGGRRRAGDPSIGLWERELPKYTQIGNAVPVPLARLVGQHLIPLISN